MAGAVVSVETFVIALSNTTGSDTATLGKSQDIDNCVPFVTKRVTSGGTAEIENHQVDVWFSSTDTLNVQRDNTSGAIEVEVTVVEFDGTRCQVISDAFQMSDVTGTASFTFPASATVTVANSFLVFHSYQNSGLANYYSSHLLRGRITSTTQATIDRGQADSNSGTIDGHYFVVESTSGDFTVDTSDIQLSSTASGQDTGISVTQANTVMIGSHKTTGMSSSSDDGAHTIDATLTSGTRIDVLRASTNGTVDWHGQLIEFTDGTAVQRNTWNETTSDGDENFTLTTPVSSTPQFSTAIVSGSMGSTTTGSFPDSDVYPPQCQLTLVDSDTGGDFDEIRIRHDTSGAPASNYISWEVIEWGTGAAGGTRRVMVVS
jgi:hypothetical protein